MGFEGSHLQACLTARHRCRALCHGCHVLCLNVHAGAYIETKHPKWHDSFNLPALNGKPMTQLYLEVCVVSLFH